MSNLGKLIWIPMVFGLLLGGGVEPFSRLILHGMVAFLCLAVYFGKPPVYGGKTLGIIGALKWIPLAILPSFLFLPSAVMSWFNPIVVERWPHREWSFAAERVDLSIDGMAQLAMLGAMIFLVALWAEGHGSRARIIEGLALAVGGWVALGWLHELLEWKQLFGFIPTRQGPTALRGTLVNPNHWAFVFSCGLPTVYAWALRSRPGRRLRGVYALCVTIAGAAFLVVTGSVAGLAALLVSFIWLALTGVKHRGLKLSIWFSLFAMGVACTLYVTSSAQVGGTWGWNSVYKRASQWLDSLAMFADSPIMGVGFGNYGDVFSMFRTFPGYTHFPHAHSDPLQWVCEVGIWGAVLSAMAIRKLPRGDEGHTPWVWPMAVMGGAAIALIDFPLHLPALSILMASLVALWLAGGPKPQRADAGMLRRGLVVAAAVQLLSMGWMGFRVYEQQALTAVAEGTSTEAQVGFIQSWTPWNSDAELMKMKATTTTAEERLQVGIRFEGDAGTQRSLGGLALKDGTPEEALTFFDAAQRLDPHDARTMLFKARTLQAEGRTLEAAQEIVKLSKEGSTIIGGVRGLPKEVFEWLPVPAWWLDELRESHPGWLHQLASYAIREEDYETALEACAVADLSPEYADAICIPRAYAYAGLGKMEEAMEVSRGFTHDFPNCTNCWLSRGNLAMKADHGVEGFMSVVKFTAIESPQHSPRMRAYTALGPLNRACFKELTEACPQDLRDNEAVLGQYRAFVSALKQGQAGDELACQATIGRLLSMESLLKMPNGLAPRVCK